MPSNFGYINARVRGLKAKLLEPEFFHQALLGADFRAFTSQLAQSPYVQDLEEAQARGSGLPVIDRAVARNFYRTARSLLSFTDGAPHEMVALLLRRYDLMNLKAIARAKHAGRSAEEAVEALLPAGELKPAVLESLAAAPDLPAVAQLLAMTRHPLSPAFGMAVRRYASDSDLYELELALDRAFYRSLLKDAEKLPVPASFVRHLKREIDAANLRTALKVRGRGVAGDELFVRGGLEIPRSTFDAIVADDSAAALSVLGGTSFAAVAEAPTLAEAEAEIRAVILRSARRLAHQDPLGIGVVLDYLHRKEAEVAKLRLLARGKYYAVPQEQLAKELERA